MLVGMLMPWPAECSRDDRLEYCWPHAFSPLMGKQNHFGLYYLEWFLFWYLLIRGGMTPQHFALGDDMPLCYGGISVLLSSRRYASRKSGKARPQRCLSDHCDHLGGVQGDSAIVFLVRFSLASLPPLKMTIPAKSHLTFVCAEKYHFGPFMLKMCELSFWLFTLN